MNPITARAWLRTRSPAAPEPLAHRIDAALAAEPATGDDVATQLAEAGLRCLRAALATSPARAAAYDLLAADALLTYACEAAAEQDSDALADLTDAFGPARFAKLLEDAR